MTHDTRTTEEIYESLRDSLTGKIQTLTNFTENSFNFVWTRAVAQELREKEVQLTVAQFSGWVEYAGGPISEDDLNDLDIDDSVTPEEVAEFTNEEHLDELVKLVGITRDPGTKASGDVTFTTQSASTTISKGTEVGTQPDSAGEFNTYVTTEQVSTGSGVTTVSASVEAEEVGASFNVGAGTVTFLPNPPGGVQGVTNSDAIDGGEDRESNADLRERAKNAVFQTSGGGTVQGMIGFIEENTGADEVDINEFPTGDAVRNYPHGHVIVSGGTDAEVLEAIRDSRPTSVEHVLRRPNTITLDVTFSVEGSGIDTTESEERVTSFLEERGLGEDLFEDKVIFVIMGSDDDIDNIKSLTYTVSDQALSFDSSQDVYDIQLGDELVDDGIGDVTGDLNGSATTFAEDTDYQEWNTSAGSTATPHDALDWSVGRTSTTETISYSSGQTEYDLEQFLADDNMIHDGITSVTNTTTSTTLTEGTGFEEADTTGDDLQNGIRFLNAQNDGDSIDVTFEYGDLPDVNVNQSSQKTFDSEKKKYRIDDAMITDGIVEVTGTLNGSSHTFTEGTDFEEWDSNGDNRPEGIDWSVGGESPDDDTDFTVTYDAGSQFLVDYDISEGDIVLSDEEKFEPGTINGSVV